ncbi:hypothetical protein CgunFtcFv8_021426 [Champsocephalus gunnari]|uniref:Uncharacterized protein n=1 Tax=Champsocephalus gunnari TaxID=52237 RepID=A0AAN8DMN7_CHAGU|nr:hypothetical protein CgunFtcFv8_021426 [Champsocephalus gunnari]
MLVLVFRGWTSSNSIKTDEVRHSATSELHLKDQDFQDQNLNRSFSCPRPPDGESPLLSPHGPAAPSGSLL